MKQHNMYTSHVVTDWLLILIYADSCLIPGKATHVNFSLFFNFVSNSCLLAVILFEVHLTFCTWWPDRHNTRSYKPPIVTSEENVFRLQSASLILRPLVSGNVINFVSHELDHAQYRKIKFAFLKFVL